jgi:hypothetical protein
MEATVRARAPWRRLALVMALVLAALAVFGAVMWHSAAPATAAVVVIDPVNHPCGNAPPTAPPTQYKVLTIVAENEKYGDVVGNTTNAPYQNQLGAKCGLIAGAHGVTHWSEANYIALTSGVVTPWSLTDCLPTANCSSGDTNIFSYALAAGLTTRSYAESAPSSCYKLNDPSGTTTPTYVPRHVPEIFYNNVSSSCATDVVPLGDSVNHTGPLFNDLAAGTLPDYGFIAPNQVNNAHDGTAKDFDTFMASVMPQILASPDYTSGHLVIVVTNDEGSGPDQAGGEDCTNQTLEAQQPSCKIAEWIIAPWTVAGTNNSTYYTHYDTLRATQRLLGLTPDKGYPWLGGAATASDSLVTNFNLMPATTTSSPTPSPTSILTNPGFETGNTNGWTTYGSYNQMAVVSDAHGGTKALQVGTTYTYATPAGISDYQPSATNLIPGAKYTGQCWVKTSATVTVSVQLHEYSRSSAGQWISANAVVRQDTTVPAGTWKQVTPVTATAIGTGTFFQFSAYGNEKAGQAVTIDDCTLVKV